MMMSNDYIDNLDLKFAQYVLQILYNAHYKCGYEVGNGCKHMKFNEILMMLQFNLEN